MQPRVALSKDPGLQNKVKILPFTEECEGSRFVTLSPKSHDILNHVSTKSTTKSLELSLPSKQLLSDLDRRKRISKQDIFYPPLKMFTHQIFEDVHNSDFTDESHKDESPKENTYTSALPNPSEEISNISFTGVTRLQMSIQDEPGETSVSSGVPKTFDISSCYNHTHNSVSSLEAPSILKSDQENWKEPTTLQSLGLTCFDMFESSNHLKTALDLRPSVASNSQSGTGDLIYEDQTGIPQIQEGDRKCPVFDELEVIFEETASLSNNDQLLQTQDALPLETNHCEEVSPPSSPYDLTLETNTTKEPFSFLEQMPYTYSDFDTSSEKEILKFDGHRLDDINRPLDNQYLASNSVSPKAEMASFLLEGQKSPSGKADVYSPTSHTSNTSEYFVGGCNGPDSPTFENSDQENYFDCKQASSDFSETDPDEPEKQSFSGRYKRSLQLLEMGRCKVWLSSGSEDFEDAALVHDSIEYNKNKDILNNSEASDEEFHLCKTSHTPRVYDTGIFDDIDPSLAGEINAELGSMSESSDDDFLTTRIVRRRVVIQSDEMVELPAESVTEEKYRDENGHLVVKKVTRKVIRACVSLDGVEGQETYTHGTSEETNATAEGAGYSKVFKRTVLRSEGDHTEVTFAECEGSPSTRQEIPDGCRISHIEKTTVVDGVRTVTHQGDPSLASDLPSAHDDFKQALGYVNDFSRAELPHVVEREITREDGTVVQRTHMRKGHTLRQTVLKEAGQPDQVCVEQKDNPREASEPCDLRQHLHQLFHHYYDEDNKVEEEE